MKKLVPAKKLSFYRKSGQLKLKGFRTATTAKQISDIFEGPSLSAREGVEVNT